MMSVWPTPRIANDAALNAVMRAAEKFGIDGGDTLDVAARDPVERIGVERGDGDRRLLQVGFAAARRGHEDLLEPAARLRRDGDPGRARPHSRARRKRPARSTFGVNGKASLRIPLMKYGLASVGPGGRPPAQDGESFTTAS